LSDDQVAKTTVTTMAREYGSPTAAARSSCVRNKQTDEPPPRYLKNKRRWRWPQHRRPPRPDTGYTAAPARHRNYRMLCVIFLPPSPLVRARPPECISLSATARRRRYNNIIISDETHHRRARTARRRSTVVSQLEGPSAVAPRAGGVVIFSAAAAAPLAHARSPSCLLYL